MILRFTGTLVLIGGVIVGTATGNMAAALVCIGVGLVLVLIGGRSR